MDFCRANLGIILCALQPLPRLVHEIPLHVGVFKSTTGKIFKSTSSRGGDVERWKRGLAQRATLGEICSGGAKLAELCSAHVAVPSPAHAPSTFHSQRNRLSRDRPSGFRGNSFLFRETCPMAVIRMRAQTKQGFARRLSPMRPQNDKEDITETPV